MPNRITAAKLNKIESGIDGVNKKVASGGTGGQGMTEEQAQQLSTAYQHSQTVHVQESDIPTKTSDLTNDSDYVNSNYVTNKTLRDHGIKVIEIPSCELSRGRGGPHCMSMALVREDL